MRGGVRWWENGSHSIPARVPELSAVARVGARAAPRHVEEDALAKTRNEVAVKTLHANHWFEGSGERQQGDSESDEPSTTLRARDLADGDRCELHADCTLRSLPMMIATARAIGRRGGLESSSSEQVMTARGKALARATLVRSQDTYYATYLAMRTHHRRLYGSVKPVSRRRKVCMSATASCVVRALLKMVSIDPR